ncbi:MAG: glycosyltransferase [Elusimicrobiales bacterium]
MKVLFSGYRNPHFLTITEYAERAFETAGAGVEFFNDRRYLIPGLLRRGIPPLERLDLLRLNLGLLRKAAVYRPDIFFACGGVRVAPYTPAELRRKGVKTVLWITDPPREDSGSISAAAPFYDRVFCSGTEAVELLEKAGLSGAKLLPYACDPELHQKQLLTGEEKNKFSCDVCFAGTVLPGLYPKRVELLESISDLDLKVWGPGTGALPPGSPLKSRTAGGNTPPAVWLKAYSAAKIVLCMHFSDPRGKYPCHQASPRVFEAMACGAFLLCDAQKDVASLFEDGRHLVIFKDARELRQKIAYYLAYPEKREAIARAGRDEVLKKHTYADRIKTVLESAGAG